MNKIRRTAEELVSRHPALFSGDFEKNKQALAQVAIIHTRSIRNQLAGAITKIIHARGPLEAAKGDEEGAQELIPESATIGERVQQEQAELGREAPASEKEQTVSSGTNSDSSSSNEDAPRISSGEGEEQPISQSAQ